WARDPQRALTYWNVLLDSAPRNTKAEWELEMYRLLAFSALGEDEAAAAVIARLHELREDAKLPEALAARGFVREHIFLSLPEPEKDVPPVSDRRVTGRLETGGTKDVRVGCFELFDERQEIAQLWRFSVIDCADPEDKV